MRAQFRKKEQDPFSQKCSTLNRLRLNKIDVSNKKCVSFEFRTDSSDTTDLNPDSIGWQVK